MGVIKAIETSYKGYRFRSRLEARWAVFFDAMGIKWDYEKEGFDLGQEGWYLPDFWLPDFEMWVEVKGDLSNDLDKSYCLASQTGKQLAILSDIPQVWDECRYHSVCNPVEIPVQLSEDEAQGKIRSMFNPSPYCSQWPIHIFCPICRHEYVHFSDALNTNAHDNWKAWSGRGDAIRIPMWCELGHKWTLLFGFHKGYTFLLLENVFDESENPLFIFARGDIAKCNQCLITARSARFEHGESGAPR